jgi:hypothetical protein
VVLGGPSSIRAPGDGLFVFWGRVTMVYTATWEEIAQMILRENGANGTVQRIYVKDGKVNVETKEK